MSIIIQRYISKFFICIILYFLAAAGYNYLITNGGNLEAVSGTSASAPFVAGLFSNVNAKRYRNCNDHVNNDNGNIVDQLPMTVVIKYDETASMFE